MSYTLGEAAKATGKSKSALSKAIQNGKISASKGENGAFHIDPSELHRLYPPLSTETRKENSKETPRNTEDTVRIKELEGLLKAAEDRIQDRESRIRDKDELLSDLRKDRDQWRQQATALLEDNRRATGLLEDEKRKATVEQGSAKKRKPKGFFQRLVGR